MVETIRDVLGKVRIFVSSISRFPNTLEKIARKQAVPMLKLLVLIFHERNRANFAQIGECLLK